MHFSLLYVWIVLLVLSVIVITAVGKNLAFFNILLKSLAHKVKQGNVTDSIPVYQVIGVYCVAILIGRTVGLYHLHVRPSILNRLLTQRTKA